MTFRPISPAHQDEGGGSTDTRPLVIITGAAGDIGSALVAALSDRYRIVGLDVEGKTADCDLIAVDLSSDTSVEAALEVLAGRYGRSVASVIHLAAYFDFTGEDSPLYRTVNVEGTRRLLAGLQAFAVEQFIYSGTMLVHRPGRPGEPIDERTPVEPRWAYPKSKAAAEEVVRRERGGIPCVLLHLAGLYDERTAVPTLAEQIRRIYERDPASHAYPGSLETGQSLLHKDDMIDAFVRAVDRRKELPPETTILVGEARAMSYGELQDRIGKLIHGEEWPTLIVPKPIAATGARLAELAEPIVPDAIDQGEKPFIKPFMVELADDHYELDISTARELLGWEPQHAIGSVLPRLVANLKSDPVAWYDANRLTLPEWLKAADEAPGDAEAMRAEAERRYRDAHQRGLWARLVCVGLGAWLIASPATLGYASWLGWSDVVSGIVVIVLSIVSLWWRAAVLRWAVAAVGVWVISAPLLFWSPSAAAYLNGTLVGALVIGFAVVARPAPAIGVSATTGPDIPPGWDYSPSAWTRRLPVIALAFVGLLISRYMAAYQLGHIDGVWDPVFAGSAADPRNGTEEIITSDLSEAFPVSDAGLGAVIYMLEILIGMIGAANRWRTMPWIVALFGFLIVPLGVVSITFIIIQPILFGTWCFLCLVAAAAMLLQIPYAVDELVATAQFLQRRRRAGRSLLWVFFAGDADEGTDKADDLDRPPSEIMRAMVGLPAAAPWTLPGCVAIGVALMFTRLTLGATGTLANVDHLIGSLVIVASVIAFAETARAVRLVNLPLAIALATATLLLADTTAQSIAGVAAALALAALSIPRGRVRSGYGTWNRLII